MAHAHVVYSENDTQAVVLSGVGPGDVFALGDVLFLHVPLPGTRNVKYLDIELDAALAPPVVAFFAAGNVCCTVDEASADALVAAVASRPRTWNFRFATNVRWTYPLLRRLALAWPEHCHVTLGDSATRGIALNRVFGDIRIQQSLWWGSWTDAIVVRFSPQRGDALVETRTTFDKNEFTILRARGATTGCVALGAAVYAQAYGILSIVSLGSCAWFLRVRGELLDREHSLEEYDVDGDTHVELCMRHVN